MLQVGSKEIKGGGVEMTVVMQLLYDDLKWW